MSEPTPAGWYPDPANSGQQRYWDGNAWTENFAPASAAAAPVASAIKKPIYQRTWFIVAAVLIGLAVVGNFVSGNSTTSSKSDSSDKKSTSSSTEQETKPETVKPKTVEAKPKSEPAKEPEKPKMTMGQQQAVSKGEDYLDFAAFSRKGLIDQLVFEGFSTADATFAVDNIAPDWNEQAAKKAQDYIDLSSFSRSGLIEQLVFEGFTQAQAEYGAKAVGY